MSKQKINKVGFDDIFYYAEKKFGVTWNRANDMFFNHSLDYHSYNEYSVGEVGDYTEGKPYEELTESEKGYFIINQYMIDKNLEDIFIDSK
jgi:hypothetical protein